MQNSHENKEKKPLTWFSLNMEKYNVSPFNNFNKELSLSLSLYVCASLCLSV